MTRSGAILLDLDRTLVDVQSFTNYEAACAAVDDTLGVIEVSDLPETGWRTATHRAMALLFSLVRDPERWRLADQIIGAHELAAVKQATAMPHLQPFLAATEQRPRAVVTLMGQRAAEAVCDAFDVSIEVVVGRRIDLTSKPAPDQLVAALALLDTPAAGAVMVGDSLWDADAAIAAGVEFIGVTNCGTSVFREGTPVAGDLDAVARLIT